MTILKVLAVGVAMVTITFATPPPGYVPKPINDKDPPKYEYGYDVADGVGGRQGHLESRDGIYARGMYYVTVPGGGQQVQYFADDWGYHPVVSYNSNTKSSSSNAQFAYGEKAVQALHQSGGNLPTGSGLSLKIQSQPQPLKLFPPVTSQLRPSFRFPSQVQPLKLVSPASSQLGPEAVSTSSSSLNLGHGSLVINHLPAGRGVPAHGGSSITYGAPVNVGVPVIPIQGYQGGEQLNYQQNVLNVSPIPSAISSQPLTQPLNLRQQQRLTATFQVGPNVPALSFTSGNSILENSGGAVGSSYQVKGSGGQTIVSGASNNGQGHHQYLVEVKPGSGQIQEESVATTNLQGASQLVVPQPISYSQSFSAGNQNNGAGAVYQSSIVDGSSSTSYSSQNNLGVAFGTKLAAIAANTGLNSVSGSYEEDQVVSVTPAPLVHTSLQPIVVPDYQEQQVLKPLTPAPLCPCESSTVAPVAIKNDAGYVAFQSSTPGSVSVTSQTTIAHIHGNTLSAYLKNERPIIQSTTLAPPIYLPVPLTSTAHVSGSPSTLLSSNNGDFGHINILPHGPTQQTIVSEESYVNSGAVTHAGYVSSPIPSPSPTPPTIVITPKPLPVASALISSQDLLAPFQAAHSLAEYSGSSEASHEISQQILPVPSPQPILRENVKLKTIVEIQKAIPIEFSQETLNSADEAQIQENGIPIDYIQHIVNAAETAEQNQQALNKQVEFGYKLNSVSNQVQSENNQVPVVSQQPYTAASLKQIQAQIEGEAEQAEDERKKQEENSVQGAIQTSISQQSIANNQQQVVSPIIGPPLTNDDKRIHEVTHHYHKQILSHINTPHRGYIQQPFRVPRPQFHNRYQHRLRLTPPVRYGEKLHQRGQRLYPNFNNIQQHNAQIALNQDFLINNHNILQSEEARQQHRINQEALQQTRQQYTRLRSLGPKYSAEISVAREIPFNAQSFQDDQQLNSAGHLLNQQILQDEVNKQQVQYSQDSVAADQELVRFVNNQQAELQFQQQLNQGDVAGVVNQGALPQQQQLVNQGTLPQQQQQLVNQNLIGVVSAQPTGQQQGTPIIAPNINSQQTGLQQQYNQQLLANVIRKPSSSALAQQAINTNHQKTLKFIRQPEGEKQAEVEKDYNQQLLEESKQDSEKQFTNEQVPLKLLLESERQLPLQHENHGFIGPIRNPELPLPTVISEDVSVEIQESRPEPLPLQQGLIGSIESQAPLIPTVPLQGSLPLQQSILNQHTNYVDSTFLQPFPIQTTKVIPVEHTKFVEVEKPVLVPHPVHVQHTKILEVKKPYPVPYPVRVEKTRVVKVDRPYAVPHPVPIEVTKLVAVDRPYPYPQPYPVPHPVPVPYAVPHPVQVPVNHYIHYPHIVRVPVKEYHPVYVPSRQMPPNPHFQREAAHAYFKSNYGYGGASQSQSFNRPHFNYKNKFSFGQTQPLKPGGIILHSQHQHITSRHRPKALNIEYGFKPPLIPSQQIYVDPQPEPFSD